jgi:hypothetical protein
MSNKESARRDVAQGAGPRPMRNVAPLSLWDK